jgi:hypothetical protein
MKNNNSQLYRNQCCGAEKPKAEIKLTPGAGAEITNCGSGSGSFLFIKDLKKFYRKKSWLQKRFFYICTVLILFGTTCINTCEKVGTQVKKGN